jgi:hypothetical protein
VTIEELTPADRLSVQMYFLRAWLGRKARRRWTVDNAWRAKTAHRARLALERAVAAALRRRRQTVTRWECGVCQHPTKREAAACARARLQASHVGLDVER